MYSGELVTLRPFTEEDSRHYLAWVNDEENADLLGRAKPVSPAEHALWYQSAIKRSDAVFFAVEDNQTRAYLGNVWLWGINWVNRNAELRILLGQNQGQGRGTEACRLLLDFAFRRLGLEKVCLYVVAHNERARRAFQKAGFESEGLLKKEFFLSGRFCDVYRLAAFTNGEEGSK